MIQAVYAGEGCQRSAAGAVYLGPALLPKVSCRGAQELISCCKGPTSLEPKSRSAARVVQAQSSKLTIFVGLVGE